MISAVLMDLDGTLCDCTELHYISLNKALQEISQFEISRTDHDANFNGLPTKRKLEMLIAAGRVNDCDKKRIWEAKQQYTKETILELLQPDWDKIELHQYLKDKNIKIACVTNSIFETARLMLRTTDQLKYMDLLIANDQIRYPKPHPEGYIRAMIQFQTMPENCLIVEDSPVGLKAAEATGANIWAVDGCHEVTLDNIKNYLE